uniref:Uncharacterized protein n=1 Tax=Rhodococcus sp. NS1 TaxID=402236 RepID=A0A097SQ17_9NOCA|nr:hypothetical protein LRS1606.180 [Rhodococcus sp. NS1]
MLRLTGPGLTCPCECRDPLHGSDERGPRRFRTCASAKRTACATGSGQSPRRGDRLLRPVHKCPLLTHRDLACRPVIEEEIQDQLLVVACHENGTTLT